MRFFGTTKVRYLVDSALKNIEKREKKIKDEEILISLLNIYKEHGKAIDEAKYTIKNLAEEIDVLLNKLAVGYTDYDIESFCICSVKIYIELSSLEPAYRVNKFDSIIYQLIESKKKPGDYKFERLITLYPIRLNSMISNAASAALDAKLRNIYQKNENIDIKTSEWQSWIENKSQEVEQIKIVLEQYHSQYNFAGLYYAFNQMHLSKEKELIKSNKAASVNRLSLISINIFAIGLALFFSFKGLEITSYYYSLFPIVTTNIILLYFYRVGLQEIRSLNSQLLQIDLRRSLCQFVHGYSEYKGSEAAKNTSFLEGFENVVFSPIVFDPNDIPSTFDGIDGVAKIIQATSKK